MLCKQTIQVKPLTNHQFIFWILLVVIAFLNNTNFIPGLILNVSSLFDPLSDYELFNDEFFWSLPKEMYSEEDGHNSRQQQVT